MQMNQENINLYLTEREHLGAALLQAIPNAAERARLAKMLDNHAAKYHDMFREYLERGAKVSAAFDRRHHTEIFNVLGDGPAEMIIGWPELCARLKLRENTIRTRFSNGGGSFYLQRPSQRDHTEPKLLVERTNTFANVDQQAMFAARASHKTDPERLGSDFTPKAAPSHKRKT